MPFKDPAKRREYDRERKRVLRSDPVKGPLELMRQAQDLAERRREGWTEQPKARERWGGDQEASSNPGWYIVGRRPALSVRRLPEDEGPGWYGSGTHAIEIQESWYEPARDADWVLDQHLNRPLAELERDWPTWFQDTLYQIALESIGFFEADGRREVRHPCAVTILNGSLVWESPSWTPDAENFDEWREQWLPEYVRQQAMWLATGCALMREGRLWQDPGYHGHATRLLIEAGGRSVMFWPLTVEGAGVAYFPAIVG